MRDAEQMWLNDRSIRALEESSPPLRWVHAIDGPASNGAGRKPKEEIRHG